MQKSETTGKAGLKGWSLDPLDHEEYRETVFQAWAEWAFHWAWFRPSVTEKRIAYTDRDGSLRVVTPDPLFFFLLRRGGVIRHMRVIDQWGQRGIPVFEGSGEVMGSMTEQEAFEFLAWTVAPRGTNHIAVIDSIPEDRTNRNAWSLSDAGMVH